MCDAGTLFFANKAANERDVNVSFSFENGELAPDDQDIGLGIDAFALHQNESTCAVRFGNTVKVCVIDY